VTALGLLAAAASSARLGAAESSSFSLSGNVRVRQEYLAGQYRTGYDADDQMLAMRSDVLAQWKHDGWTLAAMLSDSRAYETGTGSYLTANEVNTLEPVQLSVQRDFAEPFGKGSSATVMLGRFLLNVGSRRLVASDEFRNTPQGSTGLYTDLHFSNRTQWSLFYVLPQQRRPDDFESLLDNETELDHEGGDQQMWGTLLSRPDLLPGGIQGEILYVGFREKDHGSRATRDRDLHSFSLRALRAPATGRNDFEVEGIYQTGTTSTASSASAASADVNAYMVHAAAGYSFDTAWKPRLSLQFDYASGDGTGTDYQRFDTLFGMRSADFAPSGIYGMLGRANIQLAGLRLEAKPSPRFDTYLTWFWLWAADRHDTFATSGIGDRSGNSGSYAGYQLDFRARYWIVPQKLRAQLSTTWVQRGELLRDAPNASPHGNPLYGALALTWSF
jgi:hypothetical protein